MPRHIPVLVAEVISGLNLRPGMNAVDGTLGDGGHAEAILEATAPNGKLLGLDADPESLLRAKQYLYRFVERVIYRRDNFANLEKIIKANNFGNIYGIVLDLGWSSPQFDERGRGFSFEKSEPLDMRYYQSSAAGDRKSEPSATAAEIVNGYTEEKLASLFRRYGEEPLNKEIAAAVVKSRRGAKIETTLHLAEIILETYRQKLGSEKKVPWIGGLHPATRVFQALRIAVNDELEVIRQALPQAIAALERGGRLAVISFHSLEDRLVKQYFKAVENKSVTLVTRKPIVPSEEEVARNPRARSAKLRIVEKL